MPETNLNNELHTQIQYRLMENLSQSERRYRELVDNLREIVFNCDRLGNVNFLNQAWTNTLGYPVADVIGSSLGDFIDLDDRHLWTEILQNLNNGVEVYQELRFCHRTGVIVWLELSAKVNSEATFSGSLMNITDRKQVEVLLRQTNEELEARVEQRTTELIQTNQELTVTLQQLKQTQTQLVQTEKMSSLGQLVAGIAHEINNPVNFIHGNLTYLDEYIEVILQILQLYQQNYPNPSPDIQAAIKNFDLYFLQKNLTKLLKSMKSGTNRITETVLLLRNFSRLDEAEIKNVDIHEGIDNTLTILHHRFKAKSGKPTIQVIKNYAGIPRLECYPAHLNQVFMNIIHNAIDALNEAIIYQSARVITDAQQFFPKIWISTELIDSSLLQISIRDNGLGIPESIQTKIFDPFFTTKPVGKGSGLGLSISYQIVVEMHQGTLTCTSELNQGTEFSIRIPIKINPTTSAV